MSNSKSNRILCAVDVENACLGSHNVANFQHKVKSLVYGFAPTTPHVVYYSTGPSAVGNGAMLFNWRDARYVPGHGIDGADRALCDNVLRDPMALHSSRALIISGDHYFVEPVIALRDAGVEVTVMAPPASLNGRLARAASEVIYLPDLSDDEAISELLRTWNQAA